MLEIQKRRRLGVWRRVGSAVVLAAVLGSAAVTITVTASGKHKSEHWGVITRNTIGSPVADLRTGPYGSFGVMGAAAEPPYGKGSLGIYVYAPAGSTTAQQEKVDFGNEVDFFGDAVADLNQVGFHVFQTGENAGYNAITMTQSSPGNMPNIRLEINPDTVGSDGYTTMVWVPSGVPNASINRWSDYIDATSDGTWFFTGPEGTSTGCSMSTPTPCSFAAAKGALGPSATIYSIAVGKGRDKSWAGAVDGLRINDNIYDFEEEPRGVHQKKAKK